MRENQLSKDIETIERSINQIKIRHSCIKRKVDEFKIMITISTDYIIKQKENAGISDKRVRFVAYNDIKNYVFPNHGKVIDSVFSKQKSGIHAVVTGFINFKWYYSFASIQCKSKQSKMLLKMFIFTCIK